MIARQLIMRYRCHCISSRSIVYWRVYGEVHNNSIHHTWSNKSRLYLHRVGHLQHSWLAGKQFNMYVWIIDAVRLSHCNVSWAVLSCIGSPWAATIVRTSQDKLLSQFFWLWYCMCSAAVIAVAYNANVNIKTESWNPLVVVYLLFLLLPLHRFPTCYGVNVRWQTNEYSPTL